MTLTAKDVAEITRLLEESSFDELYLELEGLKLSLRRGPGTGAPPFAATAPTLTAAPPAPGPTQPPTPAVPPALGPAPTIAPTGTSAAAQPPAAAHPGAAPSAPAAQSATNPDALDVPAPMLGTFYRAPKPGAPPFVDVGAPVDEDTIIGIIEVMKLMNTVRAGIRGTVAEIVASDGTLVEYGEVLMRVSKTI